MKTLLLSLVLICAPISLSATEPPIQISTENLTLTFEDTFSSPASVNRYETRYHWGQRWLNDGEEQVYIDPAYQGSTDKPLNVNPFSFSQDGLRIRAALADPAIARYLQGQKYTSGLLTTYSSFAQRYGYFEIEAKLPAGQGLWPI